MKKITRLSIFTVALMTLASSCNRDEAGLNPQKEFRTVSITAGMAESRTILSGSAVKWEDGDRIALVFKHPESVPHVAELAADIEDGPADFAVFAGNIPMEVNVEEGYGDMGFAVYPFAAAGADGSVDFILPPVQTVRKDGSFEAGLNLSSASVSLSDITDDGDAHAQFRNALAVFRFILPADVAEVTFTGGTSPLSGKAPLKINFSDDLANGRLVIDEDAEWPQADRSMSVSLKPSEGNLSIADGVACNLLVWPGEQTSLTVSMTDIYGSRYEKTLNATLDFEASKYYTLNMSPVFDHEDLNIEDFVVTVGNIEDVLSEIDQDLGFKEDAVNDLSILLDQIQSVALVTEYLDNAVYAPYAQLSNSIVKKDFKLSYLVRPAKAMNLLLDLCEQEGNLSEVLSVCVHDGAGNLSSLKVTDAILEEDILTVSVSPLWDSFYTGSSSAAAALQISDGNTDIISDFANLVPRKGAVLGFAFSEVPVLKGTSLEYRFQYGAHDLSAASISVVHSGFESAPRLSYSGGTGYIYVDTSGSSDPSTMSLTVTLTEGEDTDSRTLTFKSAGEFKVETSGDVDYIGGEVALKVTSPAFPSYYSELQGGNWIHQTNVGSNASLTLDENTSYTSRSASVSYKITNGSYITYTSSVTITQRAYDTTLQGDYYSDGEHLLLSRKTASAANALNIVIMGDGYRKKDLLKGGKFERSARSTMDAFFGVEPYRTFKDRFNVYMMAYESLNEGPRLSTETADMHNTYFETYYNGGSSTFVSQSETGEGRVISAVRNTLGFSDSDYYRTVVIILVNTAENIGSTDYPCMENGSTSVTGDGNASFSIAILAANSTATSGLVRHEGGGHGFGRLGDEYPVDWYTASLVNERHGYGYYRNIATNTSYWSAFTSAGYGSDEVSYESYGSGGIYRSTHEKGIMWNNNGAFNAVSRHAIYERIIKQTEGYNAYSWEKFLEYDKRNRQQ